MSKKAIMVSIDEEVHKKAKEALINISGVVEDVLKNRLTGTQVTIPKEDGDKCHKCGKVETKATAKNTYGLTWLCPDEIWVCNSCLNHEIRKIVVVV